MTAREDQPEAVVLHRPHLHRLVLSVQEGGVSVAVVTRGLAPEPVDAPIAGRGDDPAGRARRNPRLRPALEGSEEGLLDRFLGDVDVTEEADQGRDRPPGLFTERSLDVGAVDLSDRSALRVVL